MVKINKHLEEKCGVRIISTQNKVDCTLDDIDQMKM